MNQDRTKRKLTAILSADVVGYSRLMSENEDATLRTLTSYPDGDFVKKLMEYNHYDSALFLIRVINNPSFAENTIALRYR
jgi:hypothetical protein